MRRFEGLRRILKSVHCSIAPPIWRSTIASSASSKRRRRRDRISCSKAWLWQLAFRFFSFGSYLRKQGVQ